MLERARSLANIELWTISLQHRRLHSPEPEDEDFLFRWLADLQFLIISLRRLQRAATIAADIALVATDIGQAVATFDAALPALAKMRNVGEHLDDYALDRPRRHDQSVSRRMIQVSAWNGTTFRWLGAELNIDDALKAARALFQSVKEAQRRHGAASRPDLSDV